MSEDKRKSTIRRLMEEGPSDPHLLRHLDLVEELQKAVAQNDRKTMSEIGRKLKENAQQKQAADLGRRAAMNAAVEEAKAESDPDQRTAKLLEAFELCAKTHVAAFDVSADKESGDAATVHLFEIANALDAIPPGRRSALVPFLDSTDVAVRVAAAVRLKELMPERVLPILRDINENESGSAKWSAYWALPRDYSGVPPAPSFTPSKKN